MTETFALSLTCLLAVIARSGVAAKTASMARPLTDGTIESGGGGAAMRVS